MAAQVGNGQHRVSQGARASVCDFTLLPKPWKEMLWDGWLDSFKKLLTENDAFIKKKIILHGLTVKYFCDLHLSKKGREKKGLH